MSAFINIFWGISEEKRPQNSNRAIDNENCVAKCLNKFLSHMASEKIISTIFVNTEKNIYNRNEIKRENKMRLR